MNLIWKILLLAAFAGMAIARPRDDDDSRETDENERRPFWGRNREGGPMRFRERKPEGDEENRDSFRPRPFGPRDSDSEEERPRSRDRENNDEENMDKPMRRPWFARRRSMMGDREGDEGRDVMRSYRPRFEQMFGSRDEQSPRFWHRKSFRRFESEDDDNDEERRPRMRRFRPRLESEEEEAQNDDDDNMRGNEMRQSRDSDDNEGEESEGRWRPHRRGRHGRRHHGRFPPCHRRRHHRRHRPWMSPREDNYDDERDMNHQKMMMRMFFMHRMMQMRRMMEQNKEDNSNMYGSQFWKRPNFYPQERSDENQQMQSWNRPSFYAQGRSDENQQTQFSRFPSPFYMSYLQRQGQALANNNNDNSNSDVSNNNDNSPLPPPPGINLSFQPQGQSNPGQTFFGSTQGRPILQINEVQTPEIDNSPTSGQDMDMQNMVNNGRDQSLPLPPGIAISSTTTTTTQSTTEDAQ